MKTIEEKIDIFLNHTNSELNKAANDISCHSTHIPENWGCVYEILVKRCVPQCMIDEIYSHCNQFWSKYNVLTKDVVIQTVKKLQDKFEDACFYSTLTDLEMLEIQ